MVKKKSDVSSKKKAVSKKVNSKNLPDTMKLGSERDIAMDFGIKVYRRFDTMVKSIVLFGSTTKRTSNHKSDIDILIIIDDMSVNWDMELIAWYREELAKLIKSNPYVKPLHVNITKLSVWWNDVLKGDPIVMNVLRFGEPIIDYGGFFTPLKNLLKQGKIKSTPEAVYTLLQKSPRHLARARQSMLAAVDGLYWTMVDSAQALLIASDLDPVSPEHITRILVDNFVKKKKLHKDYINYYDEVHKESKEIMHGSKSEVSGKELDRWLYLSEEFMKKMAALIDEIVEDKRKLN